MQSLLYTINELSFGYATSRDSTFGKNLFQRSNKITESYAMNHIVPDSAFLSVSGICVATV